MTFKGVNHDGQVVLSQPTGLPDGTEVEVVPVGLPDSIDDEPMTPDEIARTLAAMERIEPLEMTDEEREAIRADRQARKEWEKARFFEHADRLKARWE